MYLLGNSSEISTFAVCQDRMNKVREKGHKVNRKRKAFQAETVNAPEMIRKSIAVCLENS